MKCKLCSSSNVTFEFHLDTIQSLHSCKNCGVQFLDPQLSDQEIDKLYSETYYQSWGIAGKNENESSKQMKIASFNLRLKKIKEYVSDGNVLDIGCATGFYLEAAKKMNFIPYGIELSEYSSGIAKSKFGNEAIYNGTLETCKFEKGFFKCISMFDLIEHVRMPAQTLAMTSELLNKEGIIIITTPDNSSLSNKLMGKKWTHYKKEHFFYFNEQSLRYLTQQTDLKIVYVEKSKKALNLNYLHTQLNVYKHWLFTPFINIAFRLLPNSITEKNFYIAIGEITVILKKAN